MEEHELMVTERVRLECDTTMHLIEYQVFIHASHITEFSLHKIGMRKYSVVTNTVAQKSITLLSTPSPLV